MKLTNSYMRNKIVISFLLILSLSMLLSCQKDEIVDLNSNENLDKIIESEFRKYNMPGLAYVAVKEDSIVFMDAKGFANIEESKLLTPQTRMIIASVSKTIVVTAIMQLYEKGLVELDEDISNYLPFKVRNPNFPESKITLEMLLTHTSSISDKGYPASMYYLFGYVDYPVSLMEFEQNYLSESGSYFTTNNFSMNNPGTKESYSNVGAALVVCLVEHITGIDYNTYCKTNIFEPLGMTRTTFLFKETPKNEVAIPYTDNNFRNPRNPFFTYPTYPDGHLITTVEDLSKFMRAYIMEGTFNNYQLLKPETVDMIFSEYHKASNTTQGLIFIQFDSGGFELWGHDGGDPGVSTSMFFDIKKKVGAIYFINGSEIVSNTISIALLKYANQ